MTCIVRGLCNEKRGEMHVSKVMLLSKTFAVGVVVELYCDRFCKFFLSLVKKTRKIGNLAL